EATVIINAINSDLVTEVYRSTGSILGDQTLLFYRALEQDPELKELVLYGIRRTSLLIEAETDSGWIKVGSLVPQADVVTFSRAIRLINLDRFRSPLTLRLSSMTDVWHIDALSVDCSKEEPLTMHPLKMLSATSTAHQRNTQAAVAKSDSLYAIILPPERIDMTFDGSQIANMGKPVYILAAKGYLYEWLPAARDLSPADIPGWFEGTDRVSMLKYLIRHEDLFLPQIYARWRERTN
ncbi:MAG TPA: hypothetical protein VKA08_15710, partial [Balneolales bacterium]|nr:hypothetical protein [Balneolales bacterium]